MCAHLEAHDVVGPAADGGAEVASGTVCHHPQGGHHALHLGNITMPWHIEDENYLIKYNFSNNKTMTFFKPFTS